MPNRWKPPSVDPDSAADFIIDADSDEEETVPSQHQEQQQSFPPTSQQPSTNTIEPDVTNNNGNSFFNFTSFATPKIDLASTFNPLTQNANISQRQYSGNNTLDEPVVTTLIRDLKAVGVRLQAVVWPASLAQLATTQQRNLLIYARDAGINLPSNLITPDVEANDQPITENVKHLDWDLWGPLVFSLSYSMILGFMSEGSTASQVFSGAFSLIWILFAIISVNIQLLGGSISFFSAISATGYSLFPIVLCSIVAIFIKWKIVRFAVDLIFVAWSIYSATIALKCSGVLPGRIFLAIYPVGLAYALLGWLCVIT